MRYIPVATDHIKLLVGGAAEAVVGDDGNQRADRNGQPLYRVAIVSLSDDGGEPSTFQVRIAGVVPALPLLTEVNLPGLTARPWSMGDRSGISFSAESIEAINKGRAA